MSCCCLMSTLRSVEGGGESLLAAADILEGGLEGAWPLDSDEEGGGWRGRWRRRREADLASSTRLRGSSANERLSQRGSEAEAEEVLTAISRRDWAL